MRKLKVVFALLMVFNFVKAEIFEVSFPSDSSDAKKELSNFDIVSASKSGSNITYILNLTPEEALQLQILFNIETTEFLSPDDKDSYSSLDEIDMRLDEITNNNGDIAQAFVIGESVEGREIKALRISSADQKDVPEILFVGLHHAREWISYEVPLSTAEFIVKNKDSNTFLKNILNNAVLWFVPMLNPDGYLYSWEENRMWRYNRRINPDSTIGVDLNRNYDATWIKVDYVHGEKPFSEPETTAIRNLIENNVHSIPQETGIQSLDGLITYHSYGQLILYPPGSTNEPPEEIELYEELGSQMSSQIFSQCGSNYLTMQITGLYNTFGEMTEWFMTNNENKPAFTFELRPHMGDSAGFDLSPEQITDTVKENIPAAFYFISTIIEGNTEINMDPDENGVADIIQDTNYEYECSREDLEDDDLENQDDSDDYEEPDNLDTNDFTGPDLSEPDSENADDLSETKNPESSGCALTKLI